MRVLQLIDSLEAGGAERMAVNLANALVSKIEASHLCTTREEGILKGSLSTQVRYLFLERKKTLDFMALKLLFKYIKQEHIDVVHAHSSSFFMATLLKIVHPKVSIIWHDHYGNSEFLEQRPKRILYYCSKMFKVIITVNIELQNWDSKYLSCKEVVFMPNFVVPNKAKPITKLKGRPLKRILCLANLREQKDHGTLLHAYKKMIKLFPDWTLHCVGKDFGDKYAKEIKILTEELGLQEYVSFYGSCEDITHIISQCEIGVLSSKSEGLPLALLEYGQGGLATVVTNVGDNRFVISQEKYGILVPPNDSDALAESLKTYMNNETLRKQKGTALQSRISKSFSQEACIDQIMALYI